MSLVLKWQGYRDLRVLCKLYPKDSWYSEYASSSQYAKILYVSGILICYSFTGYIDRDPNMPRVLNVPVF